MFNDNLKTLNFTNLREEYVVKNDTDGTQVIAIITSN